MKYKETILIIGLRSAFFFLISYCMLYYSYKFYVPPIGGTTDFYEYQKMYLQPLNFDIAHAPFVYRQFSALITFLIIKTGIFYDAYIAYAHIDSSINQQVFFAALVSNYIALFFTAHIVSNIVDLEIRNSNISIPLLAGMLCYMSFGTSIYVLTGLVEGWTWFFIALSFYAFRTKNIFLFAVIMIISIFQKEIISIIFSSISATFFIISYIKKDKFNKKYLIMFAISLLSFLMYLTIKTALLPVYNVDFQQIIHTMLIRLLETEYLNLKFIIPVVLSQNLLFLYILFFLIAKSKKQLRHKLKTDYVIAIVISFLTLFVIGVMSAIATNLARIMLSLSPILAIYIAYYIHILDNNYQENTKITSKQQ